MAVDARRFEGPTEHLLFVLSDEANSGAPCGGVQLGCGALIGSIQFIQVEASVNQINIATRKGSFKGKTVSELLANKCELLNASVFKDQAYRILRNLKGSPAYWERYADL